MPLRSKRHMFQIVSDSIRHAMVSERSMTRAWATPPARGSTLGKVAQTAEKMRGFAAPHTLACSRGTARATVARERAARAIQQRRSRWRSSGPGWEARGKSSSPAP